MNISEKTLFVVVGPTASGKSDLAIEIAQKYGCEIVSADSRQFYKEMSIGTAVPSPEQLLQVKHHLVQSRSVTEDYTAGEFEKDALEIITHLFKTCDYAVLVGGSGLYINALCNGFDPIDKGSPEIREELVLRYKNEGLEPLLEELKALDIDYYNSVDRCNQKRVIRALEVIKSSGETYSSQRKGAKVSRPFTIKKIGISMDRELLYDRINKRVDLMVDQGLESEARSVYSLRHYNALQTVGYRELFDHFDGKIEFERAVELIKQNSRRYAKRQMTWFRADSEIKWVTNGDEIE